MIKILKKHTITFTFILCISLNSNIAHAESFVFTRDITFGSRGADVSALQQFLIDGGFLKASAPTGYFGPLTRTTLSAWQTSVGISPASGYFGSISRKKINTTVQKDRVDAIVAQSPTAISNTNGMISGCTSTTGFSGTTGASCRAKIPASATGATSPTPAPSQSASTAVATPPAPTTPTPTTVAISVDGSPVRIKIPKINVDAGFQYNGLKTDGSMEIPNNVVDVGWFTGSVRPGEKGTSVITGHVAQIRGGVLTKPGVFFSLKDLRVGDTLAVLNDKGESITFVVRETRNYDPSADATDVFTAKDNGIHMNIITCEGTWHPDQLSYSQRLVVFTDAI